MPFVGTLVPMSEYDVVVVGGGAAGLSAALVLTRARRRVAVVDAGRPRNAPAAHMHGYLGSDGLPPAALLASGRDEVSAYGGELIDGTVTRISAMARDACLRFDVALEDGRTLRARRVLVTTGLGDELPVDRDRSLVGRLGAAGDDVDRVPRLRVRVDEVLAEHVPGPRWRIGRFAMAEP